jgi:hypothetical protein
MTDIIVSLDDAADRGVLRPSLIAIFLVAAGLALWVIDEKLDYTPHNAGQLVSSQK